MRSLDASVIPWAGPEARLIVHDGHATGHGAVFLPDSGVLVAGDMCSDVEIPLLDTVAADPLGDYRTGMERLASVPGVRLVVPGHGHVGDAGELRRGLALDAAYLDAVSEGRPRGDPRLTAHSPQWMRDMHEEQVRYFKRLASARCGDRGTRQARSGIWLSRTDRGATVRRGQQQHRRVRRVQADVVLCRHEVLGGRVDLPVPRVAGEARMGSPGDLEPDPVPAAEPVGRASG